MYNADQSIGTIQVVCQSPRMLSIEQQHQAANKVVVCHNQPVIRIGVADLLKSQQYHVVATCKNLSELLIAVADHRSAIVVLDFTIDHVTFPEYAKRLLDVSSDLRVIIYSDHGVASSQALCYSLGVKAFIPMAVDPCDLFRAVDYAGRGARYFTPEVASAVFDVIDGRQHIELILKNDELNTFLWYAKGESCATIGLKLDRSERAVSHMLTRISKKLGRPRSAFSELAKSSGF